MMRRRNSFAAAWALLLMTGCQLSNHNALEPGGLQAYRIRDEFWVYFAICAVVFVVTFTAAVWAFMVGRTRETPLVDAGTQSMLRRHVTQAVAVTFVILMGFLVTDFITGRQLDTFSAQPKHALTIDVTAHQWWWEFQYEDSVPSRAIGASNELHIPVGRPVLLKLKSSDVIHSFWVPGLQGKRDLFPGYNTMLWLRADKPGVYEGQCAEFCGFQHAKMRLRVVAESPAQFGQWYEQAMRPAVPPADSITHQRQYVFLTHPCVMCHSIRGTPAGARLGPDLTHLASQAMIGANSIPNTKGHLAAWILDSQKFKPGNRMPPIALEPKDLDALLAYLETLK